MPTNNHKPGTLRYERAEASRLRNEIVNLKIDLEAERSRRRVTQQVLEELEKKELAGSRKYNTLVSLLKGLPKWRRLFLNIDTKTL